MRWKGKLWLPFLNGKAFQSSHCRPSSAVVLLLPFYSRFYAFLIREPFHFLLSPFSTSTWLELHINAELRSCNILPGSCLGREERISSLLINQKSYIHSIRCIRIWLPRTMHSVIRDWKFDETADGCLLPACPFSESSLFTGGSKAAVSTLSSLSHPLSSEYSRAVLEIRVLGSRTRRQQGKDRREDRFLNTHAEGDQPGEGKELKQRRTVKVKNYRRRRRRRHSHPHG